MQTLINTLLKILKWPIALASLLALPGVVLSLYDELKSIAAAHDQMQHFLFGVGGYVLAWLLLFRKPGTGSVLSTLEHEITHSVFALATFHPVTALKPTWKEGGHMSFRGDGNWLIFSSPYFFPTLSVVVMVAIVFVDSIYQDIASGILGATVAYHATSTWRETHWQQSDLSKIGFPFAFLFLPGANLLSYGLVLSMARASVEGGKGFLTNVLLHTESLLLVLEDAFIT